METFRQSLNYMLYSKDFLVKRIYKIHELSKLTEYKITKSMFDIVWHQMNVFSVQIKHFK